MFKRFIVKLLVGFQLNSVIFSSLLHANFFETYAKVAPDIPAYFSVTKPSGGGLHLAIASPLKNVRSVDEEDCTVSIIDTLEVPSFSALNSNTTSPHESDDEHESKTADYLDAAEGSDNESVFSAEGVAEGVDVDSSGSSFSICGLRIFVNNIGEMLITGTQEDDSRPVFLNNMGKVVFQNVKASNLQVMAASFACVGAMHADYLSLIGIENESEASSFMNSGNVTAKQLFLKNLQTTNTGLIDTGVFEVEGDFDNLGTVKAKETHLKSGNFKNQGNFISDSIAGAENLETFENTESGLVENKDDGWASFKGTTQVTNDGIIHGGKYYFRGSAFTQTGTLSGISLTFGKNTKVTTSDGQSISLQGALFSESAHDWDLRGTVKTSEFSHDGTLKLHGTLEAGSFKGFGVIELSGSLNAKNVVFIQDTLNKGALNAETLDAKQNLDVEGKVDVDELTAKSIKTQKLSQFLVRHKSHLEALTISEGAQVRLHDLQLNGLLVSNHGEFVVDGWNGDGFLKLENNGKAEIKGKHQTDNSFKFGDETHTNGLRLKLQNSSTATLVLRNGIYTPEAFDDREFTNQGTITQADAEVKVIRSAPSFNTGTWKVTGDLALPEYKCEDIGKFAVGGNLAVTTELDALKALEGLKEVKTKKLLMHAKEVDDSVSCANARVLPWITELHLQGKFVSVNEIVTPGLQLFCQDFLLKGTLSADIDEGNPQAQDGYGFLSIQAPDSKVTIEGKLFGRKGVVVKAKNILIEGKENIPGARVVNSTGKNPSENPLQLLYRRSDNAVIVSFDGPVMLNFSDELFNNFGVVGGAYFVFNGKNFRNIAGYIYGIDGTQVSQLDAENIQNAREKHESYELRQTGTYYGGGKDWCNCCGTRPGYCPYGCNKFLGSRTCETSDAAVIEHAGDLTIIYRSLTNEVSRLTSGNVLTFDARAATQSMDPGAAGNRLVLEGDTLSRAANPHQGMTVVRDRNGQDSLIRGKKAIDAKNLGEAYMHGGMHSRAITIAAVNATFENLQLNRRQASSLTRLAEHIVNRRSSMYRQLPETGEIDTSLPLSQGIFPRAIAAIGEVPEHINLYATMRSFEYIFRERMAYIYNGIQYLGLSFAEFAEITAFELQAQEGSKTQKRLISDGKATHSVDVVTNPSLTTQSLSRLATPLAFLELGRNLSLAEAEARTAAEQQRINQDAQNMAVRNRELLRQARAEVGIYIPEQEVIHGVRSEAAPLVANISEALTARGAVEISGHGGDITAGSILLESAPVRTGGSDNFYEQAARVVLANRGEGNVMNIRSHTDITMKGIVRDSGGVGSAMNISAQRAIYDVALALTSQSTTHTRHSKKKSSTTVTTKVSNIGVEQIGDGSVVMNAAQAVHQQGSTTAPGTNLSVHAPIHTSEPVYDQFYQFTTESKKGRRGLGKRNTKTTVTLSDNVKAKLTRYGGGLDAVTDVSTHAGSVFEAPSAITANQRAEFRAAEDHTSNTTSTTYQGTIWNKTKREGSRSSIFTPVEFKSNVRVISPSVLMQIKNNSDLNNLIMQDVYGNAVQPTVQMVFDTHTVDKAKTTKSLSMGASLVTKLAMAIITYGALGMETLTAHMASAGYSTLCGQAAVALVENNGDPLKATRALACADTLKSIGRSMATAGVVHGLTCAFSDTVAESTTGAATAGQTVQGSTDALLSSTTTNVAASTAATTATQAAKTLSDYAKEALIQSAAEIVVSATMDGIPLEKLLQRGLMTAALNTVAAYGAGSIGKLRSAGEVNYLAHKALHGALGAGLGAGMASIAHTDPRLGALSGAFGAMTAEMIAEGFNPEATDVEMYQLTHPHESPESVFEHFMESARKTASWSAFTSAASAFAIGLDPSIAQTTASNAVNNNFLATVPIFLIACTAMTPEYHNFFINMREEGIENALKKLGIGLVDSITVGLAVETGVGVLPYALKVGGVIVKSLQEALQMVLRNPASTAEMKQTAIAMQTNLPKVEGMVVESVRVKLFGTNKVYIDPATRTWQAMPSKYESVLANIPGKVVTTHDALNPGTLGSTLDSIAANFSGGKYAVVEIEKPMIVHRAWAPGQSKEFGKYWSLEKPTGSLQTCIDKALRPEWSQLPGTAFRVRPSEFTTVRLPAGTRIYAGEVGSQGGAWVGGDSQIYIREVLADWKIGGGGLE